MKSLATVLLAVLLAACVTKPVYNVEVNVAEGATLNSNITSTKPMDVKTDAAIDIPVSAIPDI
jgi:PBP1b-binding outer membrane lipoprotein LpoB